MTGEPTHRWLVDGFNVLHVGILRGRTRGRWWREDGRAQLLERVQAFDEPGSELWIAFDGPRPVAGDGESEKAADGGFERVGLARVVFAPSADDWLLREVRRAEPGEALTLVTADRKVADRGRHHGARIVAPKAFLALCGPEPATDSGD